MQKPRMNIIHSEKCSMQYLRPAKGWNSATECLLVLAFLFFASSSFAQSVSNEADEAKATLEKDLSDAKPEADPNLIESDTPAADPPVPEHAGIEEIIVTAEKRSTSLQETPGAISAFTGADLFDRGVYDIEALATQVPNFQYGEAFGLTRITIRGIGNQGFNDPSTAFYIDGIYQNNPTAASSLTFYDTQQVEVLGGPQGSLWGRNSTAGAINIATRPPIHDLEIFGDVLQGSYNEVFAKGVVNVPLWQDRIASRVAMYVNKRDGFQKNLFYPGEEGKNANDADNWGIRPQFLVDITDEVSVVMRGGYNHQGGVGFGDKNVGPYPERFYFVTLPLPYDNDPASPDYNPLGDIDLYVDPYHSEVSPEYGAVRPNPTDPREVRKDFVGSQDVATWDVNGTLEWDLTGLPVLGDALLTVVGSYKAESRTASADIDNTEQNMVYANITAATTDRVIDAHLRSDSDQTTEWLIGFFFLDADGSLDVGLPGEGLRSNVYTGPGGYVCAIDPQITEGNPPTPPLGFLVTCPNQFFNFQLLGDFPIELEGAFFGGSNEALGLAGYGQLTHKLLDDKLRLSLGFRYSWDRKTNYRVGGQVDTFVTSPPAPFPVDGLCATPGYETVPPRTGTWDSPTGDFKIEYLPTDENMVYGSISYGWKPGVPGGLSVSTDCSVPPLLTPDAKPEGVWAYEVGSKNRFFDNQVQANLTGFYYSYENLQVITQSNLTAFTDNAAESRVWGLEFEGIWVPTDDLTFTLIYGFLDAKYTNYTGWNYAAPAAQNPQDFSGNRMIRAPRHQATIAGEYMWSLNEYGSIIPRVQYLISDEIYFSASNRPEDLEPSFGNLQVRVRWQSVENDFFLEGFLENATDEDVRSTRAIGNALFGRPVTASFQPPRTWGVRVGASY